MLAAVLVGLATGYAEDCNGTVCSLFSVSGGGPSPAGRPGAVYTLASSIDSGYTCAPGQQIDGNGFAFHGDVIINSESVTLKNLQVVDGNVIVSGDDCSNTEIRDIRFSGSGHGAVVFRPPPGSNELVCSNSIVAGVSSSAWQWPVALAHAAGPVVVDCAPATGIINQPLESDIVTATDSCTDNFDLNVLLGVFGAGVENSVFEVPSNAAISSDNNFVSVLIFSLTVSILLLSSTYISHHGNSSPEKSGVAGGP